QGAGGGEHNQPPQKRAVAGVYRTLYDYTMVGVLCSRVRVEEKALLETLRRRAIPFERLDEDQVQFRLGHPHRRYSVVLDRSVHHGRSLYALTLLNAAGVPTVNMAQVAQTCGDKILTSAAV